VKYSLLIILLLLNVFHNAEETDSLNVEKSIREHTFSTFQPWAKPVDDYKMICELWSDGEIKDVYSKGIHDLAPFEGKMWFGYGDANYNLGSKMINYGKRCIELSYFESAEDPVPFSSFTTSEEQIDRFRILNGELWQAGIDDIFVDEMASRPGIDGNIYRLEGDEWLKFRSLSGAVHVHDVALWKGTVYSVGSGADDLEDFLDGNIYRYLWGSQTAGKEFDIVAQIGHPEQEGKGDSRWISLLPLEDVLYVFGYYSMFQETKTKVSNAVFDGKELIPFDDNHQNDLMNIFARGTQPLPDGSGLLWGIRVEEEKDNYSSIWHLDLSGKSTELEFEGHDNVVDIFLREGTNEILYLVREDKENEFIARILLADAEIPGAVKEICQFTSDVKQVSVAYWQDHLFLGMNNCQVYRSVSSEKLPNETTNKDNE